MKMKQKPQVITSSTQYENRKIKGSIFSKKYLKEVLDRKIEEWKEYKFHYEFSLTIRGWQILLAAGLILLYFKLR